MIKMRCIRNHSSTLWGGLVEGETFDVEEGYVRQIEDSGLAERVKPGKVDVEQAIESLSTPTTRTRRRKS